MIRVAVVAAVLVATAGCSGGGDARATREVEVKLPGKYMATPQIAGALRAVPGVVDVHMN